MNPQKRDLLIETQKIRELDEYIPICAICGKELLDRSSCFCSDCEKSLI